MPAPRSIDAAANGYVRHRFVRALSASFVVAAVFGLAALTVAATFYSIGQGGWASVAVAPLGLALVFLLFALPVALFVAVLGAVVDVLHRRIVGLVLFIGGLLGFLFLLVGVIYSAGVVAGFDMTSASNPEPMPRFEAVWLGAFSLVATLTLFELMLAGWWQLSVSAADFRAVRGWRPPLWRPLTAFRRYLGLPGFLSYVGAKRRLVSLLYFGVAVLNLGLLMLLLLPPMIGSGAEQAPDFNPAIAYGAMGALLLLNLFGVGAVLARLADKRATRLYQNVREWDARAPIVFLRAFDQDDAKLPAMTRDPFVKMPAGVGAAKTLDEILLEHASPYGPVIAIGDPRDPTPPLGAARVFAPGDDSNWQTIVSQLVGASKTVVMCPTTSAGVRWELELLSRMGAEKRTIFLANPEITEAETAPLFATLFAGETFPQLKRGQTPIAAYQDAKRGWRLLTAKRRNVQTYTIALNIALQAMHGRDGVPAAKPKKQRK